MANTFNETNLTLNALEQEDVSKFIQLKIAEQPLLTSVHDIVTGVTMKEQIVIVGRMGKSGIANPNCTLPNSGAGVLFSEKFWEPSNIGDTFVNCIATMNGLFKAYFKKITAYAQKFNMEGSDLAKLMVVKIEESLMQSIPRHAWFGDKTVPTAAAGAAGLKLVANAKFYNVITGLWKQIFIAVTATTIKRITISENSQTTTALQLTLAAGRAKTILEGMYGAASAQMRSNLANQFLLSGALFENYYQTLVSANALDSQSDIVNGIPVIKFRGFNVLNMETVWDADLFADFVDNTTNNAYYLPNRAVFTAPSNIPIATLEEASLSTVESYFFKSDTAKANVTTYGYSLDAKVLVEDDIVVAY